MSSSGPVVEDLVVVCVTAWDSEGPAVVERVCAAHPLLADELRERLANLQRMGLMPAGDGTAPRAIGPYRIVRCLGEGGMGTVYEAEQTEPVRRPVAIKVIKPGMDSHQVLGRFRAEQQALALMNHDCIAKIYDAGTTARGQSWFALEFVPGLPITDHCDRYRLSIDERLRLFQRVCAGVQHAHQKGILHRDLKPTNVLVGSTDREPVVKIIDFGLARAMDRQALAAALHTQQGTVIGTLEYMSPEQAGPSGGDVDARSDIYSLGVILYELLVGERPFAAKGRQAGDPGELRLHRQEHGPPKPSSRLRPPSADPAAAELRGTSVPELYRRLRGDLDCIVARALAFEPDRRYESAAALADDVGRHLTHAPVSARPASTIYLLRKLARRHRGAMIACAIAVVALVLGLVATGTQWERARRQARIAGAANDFLNRELLARAAPEHDRGKDTTVRELLDRAAIRAEIALRDDPPVEAELQQTLGCSYAALGLHAEAIAHFDRALRLRERLYSPRSLEVAETLVCLARSHFTRNGDAPRVAVMGEAAIRIFAELVPHDDQRLVQARADLARFQAASAGRRTIDLPTGVQILALLRGESPGACTARVQALLGEIERLWQAQRPAEVLAILRQELLAIPTGGRRGLLTALAAFAAQLPNQGRSHLGEALAVGVVDLGTELYGGDHPETLTARRRLATVQMEIGKEAEAERALAALLPLTETVVGVRHEGMASAVGALGCLRARQGRHDEAAAAFARELGIRTSIQEVTHRHVVIARRNLASALVPLGRFDEAESQLTEAWRVVGAGTGPSPADLRTSVARALVALAVARGDDEAAHTWYRETGRQGR